MLSLLTPESPRWLVNKKRVNEAKSAFQKIAKLNGKELYWDAGQFRKHSEASFSYSPRGTQFQNKASQFDFSQVLEVGKFPLSFDVE